MRTPLVAVLLGTDHHPFHRLLRWVDETQGASPYSWFVQYGFSTPPAGLAGCAMLGIRDLADLLGRADAVVTHGGPGLIMEARAAGHVPVVVPRDPQLHEHVDGHQQRFAARIGEDGLVRVVHRQADFLPAVAAVARAPFTVPRQTAWSSGAPAAAIGLPVDDVSARFGALVDGIVGRAE